MRRWATIGAGVLAVLPLVAGCSTAISGTATPGPDTRVPGHVYTMQPHTPPPTSTQHRPGPGAITAACPLLPASAVGDAFHVDGLRAVDRTTGRPHEYGCNYQRGDRVFASFGLLTTSASVMTPERSKQAMAKAETRCTDPQPISGLGDYATVCRLTKHPKVMAGFTLQPAGATTVLLSFDAPYTPNAGKPVSAVVRAAVSHLPGH